MFFFVRRLVGPVTSVCALAGLAALVLPAAAAQATVIRTGACDTSALSQPFTPWADFDQYKLAPGGDFESGISGWTLQGAAEQTADSESYAVTGTLGASSLALPSGSVASSPQTCVNAAYPTFRFFARTDSPGATVQVSVIYQTALGTITIPVGTVAPGSSWQPTLPMLTGSAITGALNGGTANVTLQFAAQNGTVQIDDVYVDPFGKCC